VTAPTAHGLRPAHAALTRAARRRIAAAFCIVSDVFSYFYYFAWHHVRPPSRKHGPWATRDVRDRAACAVGAVADRGVTGDRVIRGISHILLVIYSYMLI